VLAGEPENPGALHFVALVSAQAGDLAAGAKLLRRALRAKPEVAAWHRDLAVICAASGRWDEASNVCDQGLARAPDDLALLAFRARARLESGQCEEALRDYERAEALAPNDLDVREGRGRALYALKRHAEAVQALERCLEQDQKRISSHKLIAGVYHDWGYDQLAREHYRAWLDLSGNDFKAMASLAVVDWNSGHLRDALRACRTILDAGRAAPELHSFYLYALLFDPEATPAVLRRRHEEWFIANGPSEHFQSYANVPDPARRLRIGYISGEFFQSASFQFTFPLLLNHDPMQVEVFCYNTRAKSDRSTELYRGTADVWRRVNGWTDAQLTRQIRDDAIDILVDLSGHFANHRLTVFEARPAPVQVAIPNYPCTTGSSAIEYIISDPWISPLESNDTYSEEVVRLPSGFPPYGPPSDAPDVPSLPALRNGCITFGLYQRPAKVHAGVWDVVVEVLRRVPGSRLLVHYSSQDLDLPNSDARSQVVRELESRGVSGERAAFRGQVRHADHMALVSEADIALDSFPYNGQTTTCECLWMGVPVITLVGETHAGRVGFSLLSRAGLAELVATSKRQYVDIAVALALDLKRLAQLRSDLRPRLEQSTLLDARAVAGDLESQYRWMWSRWCARSGGVPGDREVVLKGPGLETRRARPAARGLATPASNLLRKGTLVLSPHFDDAALSIGGALAARAFPDPVCIYTVFGISNYTRGRFHGGSRRVTSLRRREEKRYAAALGATCAFADFLEAGLRFDSHFASIFRGHGNSDPLKPARFDRAIRDVVFKYRPRLLLCPLGLGDHWDHLLLYRAVRKMRLGLRLPVLFYEDLPYADPLGPRGVERLMALLGRRFHPLTFPIDLNQKCAGLACYPSQLGGEDTYRVRKYAWDLAKRSRVQGPCERLWTFNCAKRLGVRRLDAAFEAVNPSKQVAHQSRRLCDSAAFDVR